MIEPCQAGRMLTHDSVPGWQTPCPDGVSYAVLIAFNEGFSEFVGFCSDHGGQLETLGIFR